VVFPHVKVAPWEVLARSAMEPHRMVGRRVRRFFIRVIKRRI
jgi:hypothetical protein